MTDTAQLLRDGWEYLPYPPQSPYEFEPLCSLVRVVQPKAILEVGSRHGRSLVRLAEAAMPFVQRVTSIDMPDMCWGQRLSDHGLKAMLHSLRARNLQVEYLPVDSHGPEARSWAKENRGTFDFIFIDGDHSYEGVKQDFDTFSVCLAPQGVIAFHDIAGNENATSRGLTMGVPRFWRELKVSSTVSAVLEIIDPADKFGIGLITLKP